MKDFRRDNLVDKNFATLLSPCFQQEERNNPDKKPVGSGETVL